MARPAIIRYAGLAGSLLLAVAAYHGGARSPWQPTMTPRTILAGADGVLTPLCWLLGTVLLIGAWWAGRRLEPSVRWVWVTAALWAIPLLPGLPLGSYDVYSYACQGWQLSAGLDPYSGGVDALGCPWGDAVAPTWHSSAAPYGPVFVVLAAVAAKVGGSLAGTVAVLRVFAVVGVVVIGGCLAVLARRGGGDPGRASWWVLACPLVVVHLVAGAHNDAVMVGLVLGGLALAGARGVPRSAGPAARPPADPTLPGGAPSDIVAGNRGAPETTCGQRPTVDGTPPAWPWLLAAGVLLGLAAGVKITAIVVLPFAILLAGRPRWRPALALTGGAITALAAVSITAGLGLRWITNLSGSGVSVQWTSPPTAVGMTIDLLTGASAVPVTRAAGIAVLAVVLLILWLRCLRGADPLLGAGLALAATVALAPVFHPWYAVWPLAVLAVTGVGERWLLIPCAVAAALCLPDGYNLALATKTQGAIVVTALLVWLSVRRVRERVAA